MSEKKKKIIIITTIVLALIIIIALGYAVITGNLNLFGKTKTGSVKIETINAKIENSKGEKVDFLEPADINTLTWTTKNIGTSGILTRHTLEIYWNEGADEKSSELLYLYPANISQEEILADYETGEKQIKVEKVSKTEGNIVRYGIKYQFEGDTLDGTDMNGVSAEKDYNSPQFESTTDDKDAMLDIIEFKVFLSPKISYLYQGLPVTVTVTTEAMQYTEDGKGDWAVIDTKQIN